MHQALQHPLELTAAHTATDCIIHCNTRRNMLQHAATHCNTLHYTLQHTLQVTATHAATHCNRQHVSHTDNTHDRRPIYTTILYRCCLCVCCKMLQCVAVCCSVLQCVAVCCSVLQCVAVIHDQYTSEETYVHKEQQFSNVHIHV